MPYFDSSRIFLHFMLLEPLRYQKYFQNQTWCGIGVYFYCQKRVKKRDKKNKVIG